MLQTMQVNYIRHANALRNTQPQQTRSRNQRPVQALFGRRDPDKDTDKDEQFRIQQEMLARRRTGAWQKEVIDRRAEVSRYMKDPEYKKKVDADKRRRFDEAKKEAEKNVPKFGIIIPINPMGLPEYDGGERFDLRGKYVDNGWVDEDADVMKKIGKFFGFGKNKE